MKFCYYLIVLYYIILYYIIDYYLLLYNAYLSSVSYGGVLLSLSVIGNCDSIRDNAEDNVI